MQMIFVYCRILMFCVIGVYFNYKFKQIGKDEESFHKKFNDKKTGKIPAFYCIMNVFAKYVNLYDE